MTSNTVANYARDARQHSATAQAADNFEDAMRAAEQAADDAAAAYRNSHDDDDLVWADHAAHKAAEALEHAAKLLRAGSTGATTSAAERQAWARAEAEAHEQASGSDDFQTPGPDSNHEERAEWAAKTAARDPAHAARLAACLMMQGASTRGEEPDATATDAFAAEAGCDWTPGILAYAAQAYAKT